MSRTDLDNDPARLDLARSRLRQRIARRFSLLTETVRFGDLEIPFTRVADPNKVLDDVAAEEDRREKVAGHRLPSDQLRLPYWAELWDSAFGIAQWLADGSGFRAQGSGGEPASAGGSSSLNAARTPNPLSVLDLGCGMGLAGTVAAAVGHRVLLADLETPALLFARLNALPWRARARVRQLDWQRDRLDERFDLIIGADILYERAQWDHLEPFWRAHLSPGGTVLLGEPGRQTGDLFQPWIMGRGWDLRYHTEHLPDRGKAIRLFEISRQ